MTASVFFYKAAAFLMSIFMTALPYMGITAPTLKTKEEDCLLNVSMISDLHLEEKEAFRKIFLKAGLKSMNKAKSPIDAILVTGDLTNYGDEASLAIYYDIMKNETDIPVVTVAGNHDIGHVGDRDVTNITREEALANVIRYHNDYAGTNDTTNYYTQYINGYKFIVIGDEVIDGGHWDAISMTQEQLDFIDRELAAEEGSGKPVFVCSHWPIKGTNGEPVIWDDCGIDPAEYDVKSILEKYTNVYFISGHMHGGIKSKFIEEQYDLSCAEQINGVTYISLPTYGIINQYGIPWSGTGAQLEVYADKVIFRPRNYLTGFWYLNSEYTFDIAPEATVPTLR